MITFYIAVFLFWLIAVVMMLINLAKLRKELTISHSEILVDRTTVWTLMIVVTTFLMVRLYPDFLEAWALRQW